VVIKNSNYPIGTFQRLTLPSSWAGYQLTSVCVKDNNNCVISTQNHPPVVLKTSNGGSNWMEISVSSNDREIWDLIRYDLNDDIIAVGGADNISTVFRSETFGSYWSTVYESENFGGPLMSVGAPLSYIRDTMYAVGQYGIILRTINSGLNWSMQTAPVSNWLAVSAGHHYSRFAVAVGLNGTYDITSGALLRTTNGGEPIGIDPISSEVPGSYTLSQNCPNPFNPSTKIKFDIQKTSYTGLKIYDNLGREIETLVNKQLNPGSYEVEWNASSYPSGVYYYKLTTGGYAETKKMILLK